MVFAAAYYILCFVYLDRGDFKNAEYCIDKVRMISPDSDMVMTLEDSYEIVRKGE